MCAVSHASNNHQDLYHIIQGHLASSEMPFGGVGESGMGCYHGKEDFHCFSHIRSIVDKKTWMDLPIRYQKYSLIKEKMLRLFLR